MREILLTALRIWDDTRRMIPARNPHMGRCTPDDSPARNLLPDSSCGISRAGFRLRKETPRRAPAAGKSLPGIPLNPRFKTGSFPVDFADFESGLFRPPLRGAPAALSGGVPGATRGGTSRVTGAAVLLSIIILCLPTGFFVDYLSPLAYNACKTVEKS